jgi:hypothetical protein
MRGAARRRRLGACHYSQMLFCAPAENSADLLLAHLRPISDAALYIGRLQIRVSVAHLALHTRDNSVVVQRLFRSFGTVA